MSTISKQYNDLMKSFLKNLDRGLKQETRTATREATNEARSTITTFKRIKTGKMRRNTKAFRFVRDRRYIVNLKSKALSRNKKFNYSFTQNSGTDNAFGKGIEVEGIEFVEEGMKKAEEILSEDKINQIVDQAYRTA